MIEGNTLSYDNENHYVYMLRLTIYVVGSLVKFNDTIRLTQLGIDEVVFISEIEWLKFYSFNLFITTPSTIKIIYLHIKYLE